MREDLKKKWIESLAGKEHLGVCVCMCVCVCVCVRERERERERQKEKEREKERERDGEREKEYVCAQGSSCIKHFRKWRHSWCPDSE